MKIIKMQVNYKFIKIYISEKTYNDFKYMNDIKSLKSCVRYAVKNNKQNKDNLGITSWHFISKHLGNPSYRLNRITDNEFIVERIGSDNNE